MPKIIISKDFSDTPGPRYIKEGEFSGELFRNEILYPAVLDAIQKNETLEIILDGPAGYGTSFLEESFGGLIRENNLDYTKLVNCLIITSNEEPYLIDDIKHYMKEAHAKQKH